MSIPRIIPVLLLSDEGLVKTVKFKNPQYIGDPLNTVNLFNRLCVDELVILDIDICRNLSGEINWGLLQKIANEAQVPLSYGGGIDSLEKAHRIIKLGFEKVILNSSVDEFGNILSLLSRELGAQAVVASVDIKKNIWGKYEIYTNGATVKRKQSVFDCWGRRAYRYIY
jgi:cyclase